MFQTERTDRFSPPSFFASAVLHAAGILLLCLVSFPGSPLRTRAFRTVLIAPPPERPARIPTPKPLPPPPPRPFRPPPPHLPELAAPKLAAAPPPGAILPEAPPVPALPRVSLIPPPPAVFDPPVKLGTFETPKPPAPLPNLPPAPRKPDALHPAGFDATAEALPRPSRVTIPAGPTGDFETAQAASATRASRTPASVSGFGDARTAEASTARVSVTGPSGFADAGHDAPSASPRVATAAAGFGDASVAEAAGRPTVPSTTAAASETTPVEILAKPRPAYTAEALRLNLEGEVLIEVLFEASGQTRVLRLVRGLGHGLDESAMAAARQIRFRPARRQGTPIDSSAIVHITFQLAY